MVQSFRSQGHGELARIGVAVCHGFTGSPVSMQGWSDYLADAGFAVNMPLLAGHGTTWQELSKTPWEDWYRDFEAAYLELAARCDTVFVAGMSMGGALALRVAALHPVAGVAVVNPGLTFWGSQGQVCRVTQIRPQERACHWQRHEGAGSQRGRLCPHTHRSCPPIGPTFQNTIELLPRVTAPTVVFRSTVDHVVPDSSIDVIKEKLGAAELRIIPLENSYHVATMDNDAPLIFSQSAEFFRRNLHAI